LLKKLGDELGYTTPKDQATLEHKALLRSINNRTSLIAYTDGSLLEGKAGAGIYIYGNGTSPIRLAALVGDKYEVFDAELSAIHLALLRITKTLPFTTRMTRQIWLFSDSQAAIQRLQHNRPGPGHLMATTILRQIDDLSKFNIHTTICWVPGHTEVYGNEIADSLAKTGSQLTPKTATPVSLAWLRRQARATRIHQWKKAWSTKLKGRSYHDEPRLNLDEPIPSLHRYDSSTIVQLRTGHGYFNSYLASVKSTAQKTIRFMHCQCGAPNQTPEHLLLYCIRYNPARKQLRDAIHPLRLSLPNLLHTPVGLKGLIAFLQETKVAKRPDILRWRQEMERREEEI
jgi:ribonuclease HI